MRELSLFTGAGGGVLGTRQILGWKAIGYVEKDQYCQRVIAKHIREGRLDEAPIFGDIRNFLREGFAEQYQGVADVISAGFPCQPFSHAGKRMGKIDDRNLWPETMECIRIIRPRHAILENVVGLLRSGYFGDILGDLVQSGYDCRWRILSAAELGAPHKRDRLWIVATDNRHEEVADTEGQREQWSGLRAHEPESQRRRRPGDGSEQGHAGVYQAEPGRWTAEDVGSDDWWTAEPGMGRVADGVADRLDRLRAIGNGQVPVVAAAAWLLLAPTEAQPKAHEQADCPCCGESYCVTSDRHWYDCEECMGKAEEEW